MKRALVSVSDKTNLVPFVSSLVELGYEIISTGGTKKALEAAGIKTIGISEVTDFPEIMDGRVKTLHPKVHGALLCVRDNPDHVRQIEELGIQYIDLVCVNLYPFKETVQKPGVSHEEIIENIDIGGPSMLRSASKNYKFIPVLCDPSDYDAVVKELRENGETSLTTREYLAAKVFRHTASYDTMIASYLTERTGEKYPEKFTITFDKVQELRYGENPHQSAAFYKGMNPQYSLANAKQLHGKELSYNNIQDGNAAIEILKDFEGQPAVVGLKHMNPCGVGIGKTIEEAWDKAYEADPVSIFGGIVAFNEPIHASVAEKLSKIFLEIIIAPAFDEDAFEILSKKKNIRLMQLDTSLEVNAKYKVTNVNDGLLVQDIDDHKITAEDLRCVTNRKPTEEELEQLLFAWKVVKHVKSNAIVLVKDNMTIGVGAGQMNRVGAAKIAIEQAGEKAKGSIMSSDAFFPMPDTVEEAVKAGVTAIIQPGGSIFGGIVAFNEPIHASVAEKLSKIFLEIIIAPAFDEDAFEILSKKKNIRLMQLDTSLEVNAKYKVTNVNDGLLVQDIDDHKITAEDLRCVTNRKPTEEELEQLLFAWKVVKHVKSNAIVLVKDNMTIGVGAGQMNRVGAAKIAIEQAGEKAKGSIMSSDAFFPMPDTVEEAVKAGVTAIIQPGGSIKDQLSIDVCNEHGIAMVYTGVRHFKH